MGRGGNLLYQPRENQQANTSLLTNQPLPEVDFKTCLDSTLFTVKVKQQTFIGDEAIFLALKQPPEILGEKEIIQLDEFLVNYDPNPFSDEYIQPPNKRLADVLAAEEGDFSVVQALTNKFVTTRYTRFTAVIDKPVKLEPGMWTASLRDKFIHSTELLLADKLFANGVWKYFCSPELEESFVYFCDKQVKMVVPVIG